ITTYLVLDGKDAFQSNQVAIFADTAIFGLILAFFWARNGQSPGLRAYNLHLIDIRSKTRPSFLRSLWRYFTFLLAGASVIGLLLAFFRKDKKNLHDLLSQTIVIT
ncbi:MAG: RDD family protein, partial [Campylobacteraceae bacterium]|nr:RDD family protein [Campylobacteraceae bacterium]